MTRRSQWMVVGAVVLLLGGGAAVATLAMRDQLFPVTVGSNAPSFTAYTMDAARQAKSIEDYRGDVVLLNIWATWCGPCRREMPSLDRLQENLAGADFEVVALSIDRGGVDTVRKFYADLGIRNIRIYIDSSGNATSDLATVGVPATLLINRDGRELGRLVGPAEWDEPGIVQFLRRIIAQGAGSTAPAKRSAPHGRHCQCSAMSRRGMRRTRHSAASRRPTG